MVAAGGGVVRNGLNSVGYSRIHVKVRDASNPVVCGSLTQPQAGEEPRTRSQGVKGREEAKAEVVSGHFAQDRDDSRKRVSFKTS